jgi:chemotaxis protein methyltransferase CheR
MNPITEIEFGLLRDFLRRETGITVPDSKQYLFSTRLDGIMDEWKCSSFSDLFLRLSGGDEALVRFVIEAMTTHESGFYREPHHFDVLCDVVLPEILERKLRTSTFLAPTIRILSAGCSFGQEAYTIAMCLERWQEKYPSSVMPKISILGIDLSTRALERARQGVYTTLELGFHLPQDVQDRYFRQDGDYWHLCPSIREQVSFQSGNLSRSLSEFGMYDVIFCRNVIIYFSPEEKIAVLDRLRNCLDADGALFIGSAENLYGIEVGLASRMCEQSTYYEIPRSPIQTLQKVVPWSS